MKKFFLFFAAISAMVFCNMSISSCSDNDDNNSETTPTVPEAQHGINIGYATNGDEYSLLYCEQNINKYLKTSFESVSGVTLSSNTIYCDNNAAYTSVLSIIKGSTHQFNEVIKSISGCADATITFQEGSTVLFTYYYGLQSLPTGTWTATSGEDCSIFIATNTASTDNVQHAVLTYQSETINGLAGVEGFCVQFVSTGEDYRLVMDYGYEATSTKEFKGTLYKITRTATEDPNVAKRDTTVLIQGVTFKQK